MTCFNLRAVAGAGLLVGTMGLTAGCSKDPPRDLLRLQAYRCPKPGEQLCKDGPRGALIPADSLPPADEAFQVWAWHPGKGRVAYRLRWHSRLADDSGAPQASREAETVIPEVADSSMLSYNFTSATKTRYVLHVYLETKRGAVQDQDSLVWDFSRLAEPSTAEAPHQHTP